MTYPTHDPESRHFDPSTPVGSGEPVYAPPVPIGYDPTTGAPLYAPTPAADLPVAAPSSEPPTEGSPAIDPSRPCHMTAGDLFESLNGFDEIAVTTRFGATITELRADPVTLGRALAFVDMRRKAQGQPNADQSAYDGAMGLTIKQVTNAYFQPEPKKADATASAEGNGEPSTSSAPA